MLYLNKLLNEIKQNPKIFKTPDIILALGLTSTHIKDLKKNALENQLITQIKQEYYLTEKGEEYLLKNPVISWVSKEYDIRPDINVEYLKSEKTTSVLTRAIRLLAKHFIENELIKEFSLEYALKEDLKKCSKLSLMLEEEILSGKRKNLEKIFEKFVQKGITKPLISIILLEILTKNIEKIAIYEKGQFQLKLDVLMFDRMVVVPQNFEIQKTEMPDEYLLKDVSKIILNNKNNNILEITKGLYKTVKSFDKYVMNTQNLTKKTLRFRSTIVNAKDPISLFERDIPKAFGYENLQKCNRDFLNDLKISLNELKFCIENLTKELRTFFLDSFNAKTEEELSERFLAIKEFIGEKELGILLNTVIDTNVSEDLWISRIATYINKYRVPKDWTDEDFANFKTKTKELALKFFVLEATIGTSEKATSKDYHLVLNKFLNLSKQEQLILLRKVVNL